jgi:hypothetical protein
LKKTLFTLSLALLAISLIVVIACNKTISSSANTNGNPNNIPANITVTASLQGRVVDPNGLPVEGAAVNSGTATVTTDVNGLFSFRNISMSSRFGYVQVSKQGYFTGSRSIITGPGSANYVSIQLVPRTLTGTFPAPSGGKIALQTGDSAAFSPASVVTASTGTAYTGTVYVYAQYLDPTDSTLYKYMPGDLRGIGSNGYETGLQSFGMMDVEMQDGLGNKLQLASGQTATLTWAIPQTLQALATATIPLWYFNDTTGQWTEQGMAIREGNNYVGQVGHFTFWNCDAPIGTVNFSVYLKDQHGNPLPYTYVEFISAGYGVRGGYTDSTGYATGLVPKGQHLLMEVMTECGSMEGGFNVGPAVSDVNLGTVTVNIINAELTLTGTVVNCSSNPVDSGYVNVLLDGLNYRAAVANGAFTLPINRCFLSTDPVQLLAVDLSDNQQSSITTISADTGTVNVGQLTACSVANTTPFINFTVGGNSYSYVEPQISIGYTYNSNTSSVYMYVDSANNNPITLAISGLNAAGTYTDSIYMIAGGSEYYGLITYTVTAFGPINSYVQGTFTGPVVNDNNAQQQSTLTGSFNVLRTQ